MSYCNTCIHHDVCGMEGVDDEGMTYCADRLEPYEDAISRQEALEIVEREQNKGDALSEIEKLPYVTPKQRTGHWIYDRTRDWDGECKYECSECGMGSDVDYAYCMRCGAMMQEVEE